MQHANERTLRLNKRRSSSGAGGFREEGVDARLATDRTDRCEAFPRFPRTASGNPVRLACHNVWLNKVGYSTAFKGEAHLPKVKKWNVFSVRILRVNVR
jgi:hypothetical protein